MTISCIQILLMSLIDLSIKTSWDLKGLINPKVHKTLNAALINEAKMNSNYFDPAFVINVGEKLDSMEQESVCIQIKAAVIHIIQLGIQILNWTFYC